MATTAVTNLEYNHYNGGWHGWSSNLYGGYAGNNNYVTVLKFKTPDVNIVPDTTKLSIKIPIVRQRPNSTPNSGTLYFKLVASDPTGGNFSNFKIPSASDCQASWKYNYVDLQIHYTDPDDPTDTGTQYGDPEKYGNKVKNSSIPKITTSLKGNTFYYLIIGCSAFDITIGDSVHKPKYYINLEYTSYTLGGSPTVSVKDNRNNKVTISGALGKNGTNNTIKSATLYYTTDGSDPSKSSTRVTTALAAVSSGSYSNDVSITKDCTVRAYVECKFTYNTTSASGQLPNGTTARYYKAPNKPGTPILTYKKSRLTVKEPWTFTWTAATKGNNNSPVAGYYIMLLRKAKGESSFKYVCRLTNNDNNYLGIKKENQTDTNYYLRRESTSCKAIIKDPAAFGFNPGDEVKLRIMAYAWNGAKKVLPSEAVDSANYLVQNAGIVRVKVSGSWKEGQVYVKVNGIWKEAETVNTKVNGIWKESR
jgi:hypothetical protein